MCPSNTDANTTVGARTTVRAASVADFEKAGVADIVSFGQQSRAHLLHTGNKRYPWNDIERPSKIFNYLTINTDMGLLEKLKLRIQALLTWLFIRVLKRSKLEGTEELTLLNEPVKIYTFRKSSDIYAQATPFGTIIWNKTRTEELSTEGQRFVLHHELSHKNRNGIYKGLLYGMAVSGAGGIVILMYSGIFFLLGSSFAELAEPVTTGFLMTVAFAALFRIEETWADYDAVCELGEEKFKSAYDEIGSDHEPTMRSRIIRKLFYTHPDRTVRLYQFLQEKESISVI